MHAHFTHIYTSMAISSFVKLLLVLLTTAATIRLTAAAAAPAQPPSPTPSPSPSTPPPAVQDKQLRNILDALIGTGDYGGWANLLTVANPNSLPLTATLFVPSNTAISRLLSATTAGATLDPLLIPYHIVPQRLTFSDLHRLTNRTRLLTLLRSNFIVVTSNSPASFAVDDSQILQPDIFLNDAFALHGVDKILNYSIFGRRVAPLSLPPENAANLLRRKKKRLPVVNSNVTTSGAWRYCPSTWVILSTLLVLFTFKIMSSMRKYL